MKQFYERVHGHEPAGNEHITFSKKLNLGNYSAEFVAILTDKLSLESVTLGDFYGIGK